MKTCYQLSQQNLVELHQLYLDEWWTKDRTFTETQQVVQGSQICIALIDNTGSLRGFARVLTDYVVKALIFDVIVDKAYRRQGLGDKLITLIKSHSALTQVKCFELYCLPALELFYQEHQFTNDVSGIQLMRCTNTLSNKSK